MSDATPAAPPRPWIWAALLFVAMGGVAAASILELIVQPWTTVLALLAMSPILPLARAARRRAEDQGCMSPARRAYNTRGLIASVLYMGSFWVAVSVHDRVPPDSPVLWLLALAPALPLLGMIWAMARYLAEETDEYLRHRATVGALAGLALVLVLGTVWGFLETFGLVPHVWSWWVFPAWAIGLGLGEAWIRVRGE